jgi:16S rRNA (guanine527-N7)-methyltransferase
MVTELMPEHASVCDIGSGAGLPGLVIALRRPDLRLVLVEPLLRRTTFLDEAVALLGLTNVTVHRGRAEDLHDRQEFDVVTSRAVAPLDRLSGWSLPLVRTGGVFLAMKGSGARAEVEASRAALEEFGGVDVRVEMVGAGVVDPPVTVVRVVKGAPMQTRESQTKRKPRSRRS